MAVDFDTPPLYDPVTKNQDDYLSAIWLSWFSSFFETLTSYLSQSGMFLPQLTTNQRDTLQNPVNGQIIYNTTLNAPQIYQNGAWKTFTTS